MLQIRSTMTACLVICLVLGLLTTGLLSGCAGDSNRPGLEAVAPLLSQPAPGSSPAPADPTAPATAEPTNPPVIPGVECLPEGERLTARLIKVTDGDTIVVELDGEQVKLRYIGVDTPESDEPFGPTASDFNATLLGQGDLILVRDQSEVDPFGRMLAYVLVGGRFINYELVRAGWAISKAYPPDTACLAVFDQAQAQVDSLGLWALLPTPALRSGGLSLTPPANCDPSYPDVCIPPGPPYLNCPDITQRNFRVLAPDPHGFDLDFDGIGCEE